MVESSDKMGNSNNSWFISCCAICQELGGNYEGYPDWAIWMGWTTVIIPILVGIGLALKPKEVKV